MRIYNSINTIESRILPYRENKCLVCCEIGRCSFSQRGVPPSPDGATIGIALKRKIIKIELLWPNVKTTLSVDKWDREYLENVGVEKCKHIKTMYCL